MAGSVGGEICAHIFCKIAEQIGHTAQFSGLRDKPNMACGEYYKVSCESSFVREATKTCPKYDEGTAFLTITWHQAMDAVLIMLNHIEL